MMGASFSSLSITSGEVHVQVNKTRCLRMSEQITSAAVNLQLPQLALTAQVMKKYAKWFQL